MHFNWCVLVGLCVGFMECSVTRFPSEKLSGMVVAQEFYIALSTHSNTCNIDGRVGLSRYIRSSLYRHTVADERRKKEAHKTM